MIVYIHGFGGSGLGVKAQIFRQMFQKEGVIAPSLPVSPDLAVDTLGQLIQAFLSRQKVYLIGSSLGGFYALYLAKRYGLQSVLINPAVDAPQSLHKYEGKNSSFYDGTVYEYNSSHLDQLQKYTVSRIDQSRLLLLLQEDDRVIDYKVAMRRFQDAKTVLRSGGGHGYSGIENEIEGIKSFFGME